MRREVIEISVIFGSLVIWLMGRTRKNAELAESQTPSPSVSVATSAEESATMSPTPPMASDQNRLQGEPDVFGLTDVRLEITAGIANDRTDIIEELQNLGALDGSWSDDEKYFSLYRAPASLIHKVYPDALETLNLHAHLIDSHKIPITYAYGTFSDVERALKEFLNTSANWNSVAQERGHFVGGSYFTSDSFLYLDKDYLETSMRIGIISRARLEESIHAELKKLREFFQ